MDNVLRVHALDCQMISNANGFEKLIKINNACVEESQVFVLAPLNSGILSFSELLESAKMREEKIWSLLEKSQNAWSSLFDTLFLDTKDVMDKQIKKSFENMEDLLRSVWLLEDVSATTETYFNSLTNYFVAILASAVFNSKNIKASYISVEEAVKKQSFPSGVTFVYGAMLKPTNYKYKDKEGESEYTASLIASNAEGFLTFWNNKSLLCSARNRDIPSARVISRLTYAEATELSFFGAPIVHPHYFIPAQSKGLEIELRYWGEISNRGTLITNTVLPVDERFPVKAFSVMRNIAIINIEGAGMAGVPGISSRLFSVLRESDISVILISQGSSEYSICFAIHQVQMTKAVNCVRKEFAYEIENNSIASVTATGSMAILAAVGDMMTGNRGISGKFFSALGSASVNITAIAQGASERNISAVINEKDSTRALTAVYGAFFLSEQTLSIGLIGPGNIGATLLNQLARESERLRKQFDVDIRIRGIANSCKMLLSEEGVKLEHWKESFDAEAIDFDMDKFLSHVGAEYYPQAVLIDCTTSAALSGQYASWLERFHIITPNKKAATASFEYYKSLFDISKKNKKRFLYETTVGAGLPIINTLVDLVQTGDEIKKIEGMVSGTLAWLFSKYDGSVPFSQLVLEAKNLGYTEPDPRDDLSGMDVARKTVILAREIDLKVEVADLVITSLVPEFLQETSKEEFLARLTEMDDIMLEKVNEAKKEGKVLRYVGKIDNGKCSVALEKYSLSHPFAQAEGTDNVIAFTTSRYTEKQPLVVKGPGAGPEVTAGGVFADILRLTVYLGAGIQ